MLTSNMKFCVVEGHGKMEDICEILTQFSVLAINTSPNLTFWAWTNKPVHGIQHFQMLHFGRNCIFYVVIYSLAFRLTKEPCSHLCGHLVLTLQWCHYDHGGVSNHQPHCCLLNRLFRRRSKKTSKLRVTGLCAGNSPGPMNSPHKGPVMRKMFPFDDVIMEKATSHHTK